MLKIGITGGIGSGKSTVCNIFKQLGIPIYNSDYEAKKLLDSNEIIEFYKNEFSNDVFVNGSLDKQKIATLIFDNPEALQRVNNFIHPIVNDNFAKWVINQKNSKYVVKESALLLDKNIKGDLNYVVLVLAPKELRLKRVILRDNTSESEVLKRIKNQIPDEAKIKFASYIISNDEHSLLLPQVLKLHQMFINESTI
jgi:dephospho-CoA kinase